ncbi:MAG TPA: ACT domain-containing protein [Chthoniobacteraceae bacterium]|nr:ACT domain-containing protein [Chthoniobacteraceae bacterium]
MEIVPQLSIFLANEPGTLAKVCDELASAKINIYALTISDTVDHAVVRMVVSDPQHALHLFGEHGLLVVENNVLMIDNDNKPGSLSLIASKLAAAKLNIEYAYLATNPTSRRGLLILRVAHTKRALETLTREEGVPAPAKAAKPAKAKAKAKAKAG